MVINGHGNLFVFYVHAQLAQRPATLVFLFSFFPFTFFCSMLHTHWLFDKLMPHISALLRHASHRVVFTAFDFLDHVISSLASEEGFGEFLMPSINMDEFNYLVRCFVDQMVRTPFEKRRMAAFKTLNRLFDVLHSGSRVPDARNSEFRERGKLRFDALYKLQEECPYVSLSTQLVSRYGVLIA
jgi:hypothetical protein